MPQVEQEIREDLVISMREHGGYLSLPVVDQGKVAVLLRNGRVRGIVQPGRRLMWRLPLQKLDIYLVETKVRNLNIVSQGEFLTGDHWRVNVSLWVSYQVVQPGRVVVEFAQPVHALYSTVKDLLGQLINQENFQSLSTQGRPIVRQGVLGGSSQVEQLLGMRLVDVRIDDLTLPEQVGSAFDERRVAQMRGEASQWHIRGKWQDMPDSVQRRHMQERLVDGAMFVNPPLPGSLVGSEPPGAPQISSPPPGGQVIDGQVVPTQRLGGNVWGQLVVVAGAQQGVVFSLHAPAMTIGRAADNHIVLQDAAVSSRHAQIQQPGLLVDLNSSNGTFVNGHRIQKAQLSGGETIRIGETHFRFEVG